MRTLPNYLKGDFRQFAELVLEGNSKQFVWQKRPLTVRVTTSHHSPLYPLRGIAHSWSRDGPNIKHF